MARPGPLRDALRYVADTLGRTHRRTAVFMNDQCHLTIKKVCGWDTNFLTLPGSFASPASASDLAGDPLEHLWGIVPSQIVALTRCETRSHLDVNFVPARFTRRNLIQ